MLITNIKITVISSKDELYPLTYKGTHSLKYKLLKIKAKSFNKYFGKIWL
jgi:hypothetical protein